jgi:hypothetical protein
MAFVNIPARRDGALAYGLRPKADAIQSRETQWGG